MAREIFEVLQKELGLKKKDVDETKNKYQSHSGSSDWYGALIKFISDIKDKTAKIQTLTKKIDEDTDEIKAAVNNIKTN